MIHSDPTLRKIRDGLFHGLRDYTKSFPDFSIPQKFEMARPSEGHALLARMNESLRDDDEMLLYVHLPFCYHECVFCNTAPRRANREGQARYLASLLGEIRLYGDAGIFQGKRIRSVYFGGGTPTAYPTEDLRAILDALDAYCEFARGNIVTVEAYPKHLCGNGRPRELADAGVHRLSVGCQTFDPAVAALVNRSNPADQIREVLAECHAAGLTVNVDMMIGLPGQTLEGLHDDLAALDELRPDAVEYMRHEIVNPLATALYDSRPELLTDDDALFAMVVDSQAWMERNGYEQNGWFESDRFFPYRYHWLQEIPFVGLGSRARSFTRHLSVDKHESLQIYSQLIDRGDPAIARSLALGSQDQMYRAVFLRLQLKRGVDLDEIDRRFPQSSHELTPLLDDLEAHGCVSRDGATARLTRYGSYFVEDVCCAVIDYALQRCGYPPSYRRMPHSAGSRTARLDH
ncbi:MAG: radical SAM protein [Deltaproteobacteria bacterium]|nr:radical SAM protein [Deltaproteobacteria bacterium]MBM4268546.1 radical SAM protein [Deltaproteobacteria bacterium]